MPDRPDLNEERLPALWSGNRRADLALLVGCGVAQAVVGGAGALLLRELLRTPASSSRTWMFAALLVAGLLVGCLRAAERVLAERLGQRYVHQVRLGLMRHALYRGEIRSLGVAMARATNDLTSVKNWVSLGIAPLVVGIPLILGVEAVLFWIEPWFAVALAVPLVGLAVTVRLLTPVAYDRSRLLRRRRGRLSGQIADSMLAVPAIRSARGSHREVRRIGELSERMAATAVHRAKAAGALRGAAAATAGLTTALVVGFGLLEGLSTSSIAGALTLVGLLTAPIQDLGRVAEYRQSYRAARRIIAPVVDDGSELERRSAAQLSATDLSAPAHVVVRSTGPVGGRVLPDLVARPGDVVLVRTGDASTDVEILAGIVGLRDLPLALEIGGVPLDEMGRDARSLIGYAEHGMLLPRGSIARSARYRCPEATDDELQCILEAVGLADRISRFADGVDTRLVHGGSPLIASERALLLLARAVLGSPPLVVLNNLDADLGRDGREVMRKVLNGYDGVVLLVSDQPDEIVEGYQTWPPPG